MSRILVLCMTATLCSAQAQQPKPEQKGDPEIAKLVKEIDDLKQLTADQDKRIADLEKTVKMLQALLVPVPKPIPAPTPAWTSASNWNLIKAGMSEAQVVDLLGPATRVQSVTDSRTLFYEPDPRSSSTLSGSVTLKDDRVIAMSPPAF